MMGIVDSLDFDEANLPNAVRALMPHDRRFAVADDVERERVIQDRRRQT